ncbi:MAG: hypothetical protein K9M56_05775 [Victivallales bacterium]|nr:hypothetical protein [Victivallales bacterium]
MNTNNNSCCSAEDKSNFSKYSESYVLTTKLTPLGFIPVISSKINFRDKLEHFKCRVSSFRNNYKIEPGLYALGTPDESSEVFVTANYKYTFDVLRKELNNFNCWILVLETGGINVWCAAGKGTFGTEELVEKIKETQLERLVSHKRLILPQLGAVGISAYEVENQSGFKVIYGPVKAEDIKSFIKNNYEAFENARRVKFPIWERIKVAPLELVPALKKFFYLSIVFLIFFGLRKEGIMFKDIYYIGLPMILLTFSALVSGAILVPVLLPFLPFRSFALKGCVTGLIAPLISLFCFSNFLLILFCWIFLPAVSSFTALLFTGTTTYTSPSGVTKELKIGLPIYIAGIVVCILILIIYKLSVLGVI